MQSSFALQNCFTMPTTQKLSILSTDLTFFLSLSGSVNPGADCRLVGRRIIGFRKDARMTVIHAWRHRAPDSFYIALGGGA